MMMANPPEEGPRHISWGEMLGPRSVELSEMAEAGFEPATRGL